MSIQEREINKKHAYKMKWSLSNYLPLIFIVLVIVLLCYVHSLSAGNYADFFPINGTFQNYNPVRRLLAGQIPYRDFYDYLGIGHLYIGSLFTLLFGGNYVASLRAFSFLTFGGFSSFAFLIFYSVCRKKDLAGSLTIFVMLFLLILPIIYKNSYTTGNQILSALIYALGTGNSARLIRGLILPISCGLLYGAYFIYERWIGNINFKYKEFLIPLTFGVISGFSFGWSNDYGIGTWLSLLILGFWLTICRKNSVSFIFKSTILMIIISILSISIFISIFTLGNLSSWYSINFGGGSYQNWYFNTIGVKSYYITDINMYLPVLIQAALALYYLGKLYVLRGTKYGFLRYGILALLNMTCFCVVNEYKLLSSGMLYEVAFSVLTLSIIAEIINLLYILVQKKELQKKLVIASIVLAMLWSINAAKYEYRFAIGSKEGVYIKELGGNSRVLGNDLLNTRIFLQDDQFFATYSSGQEVLSNIFQPSGTDYIIHVLGDKEREDYLSSFKNGNFKYTATIREDYTSWELWVLRANWFFYRELYRNWHPIYANRYEMYWERNENDTDNVILDGYTVNVVNINETTKKLIVSCNRNISGIADVFVDYATNKKNNLFSKLIFRCDVKISNTDANLTAEEKEKESNYLRGTSAEYIPIRVSNGYGEVTITSNPSNNTYLTINDAKCDGIYTVGYQYLLIESVDLETNTFILKSTLNSRDAINDIYFVKYGDIEYTVENIESNGDEIRIAVDKKIIELQNQPSILKVK